jgi:hypothetical protein
MSNKKLDKSHNIKCLLLTEKNTYVNVF